MRIVLKNDFDRIIEYIAQRCKDFPKYVNAGPGQDDDPITLITLGYQFDQAGCEFENENDQAKMNMTRTSRELPAP